MSGASPPDGRVSLGFSGLLASVGDHIGHFYLTRREWRDFLVPFLQTGLQEGDKCVYVMSPGSGWAEVRGALEQRGVKVDEALAAGQLEVADGKESVDEMRDALQDAIEDVRARFHLLRWGGDMTWSLGKMPNSTRLMEWEAACNVIEHPPAVFLCQYDLTQFRGNVVFDALKTHPVCVIGKAIRHNPYYEDPEAFLEELRRREGEGAR